MRSVKFHPRDITLATFAAGVMDEASGVVVATHLASCAECRQALHDLEALGGVCLEEAEPAPMRDDALDSFWLRAGEQEPAQRRASHFASNDFDAASTPPLSAFLDGGLDDVNWRGVAPGLSQHVIDAGGYRKGALRLLKIAPGTKIPMHTHRGDELTLVLRGAYRDSIGTFEAGDLADLDGDAEHEPLAIGDEPCICLIATNAPLSFRGLVGKVVQPFVGL